MSFMKKTKKFLAVGLVALALSVMTVDAIAGQVTGAIFTTLVDGSAVNHNIYNAKQDVYLNGGPHSPAGLCTAAGLPDGDYYFQVTDPSGKYLLSSDSLAQRKVKVIGGVIAAYLGNTHLVGSGKCGSLTVQLYPFKDTPNPGGEYKVWMASVQSVDSSRRFIPSQSKTDNFKAPGETADSDNDGLTNDAEALLGTNPNNPDTDGDGLTDGQEVNDFQTNPLNPDTDGDGIPDGKDPCPKDFGLEC